MGKDGTRAIGWAHPSWCVRPYRGSNDHDPHASGRERVEADFPSDMVIEAYLVQFDGVLDSVVRQQRRVDVAARRDRRAGLPARRRPRAEQAPLVAVEFSEPGEEPVSVLLTFAQLRRLSEALSRLVELSVPA